MRRTPIAACCGLILAVPAFAETAADPLLDEIVVVATRSPVPLAELNSDVTVLRAEDIRASGAATLSELLQAQSGVEIAALGSPGSQSSLFLRGTNSSHVVVLVDGQRIYSATAGTTALEHIPLGQVERIEILRGPASSLYGADAIGGVVHIFTRAGLGKPGMRIEAGAGSFGSYRAAADYVDQIGDTRVALALGTLESDGFDATRPGVWGHNPDDDGYRNRNASLQIEHTLSAEHALGLNGFLANGRSQFDSNVDSDDVQKQRLSSFALYSRNNFSAQWESTLRIGETTDRLHNLAWDSRIQTRQRLYQWQNNLTLPAGTLLLGAERTEQEVDGNTAYAVDRRRVDAYLAGYRLETGQHGFQLNLRHDDNSQFGGHTTGAASYGYRFAPGWRLTAAAGTAFKAPTFNDLYWPSGYCCAGNPDLQPERAVNRELGVNWRSGAASFSAIYFHNRVKDLIAISDDWSTMVNVHRATIEGLSLQAQAEVQGWRVKASIDLQSPEDADSGNLLPRRAKRHGALELSRRLGDWALRGQFAASDYRYDNAANTKKLGGYAVVNLGLDYHFGKTLVLSGRVNNLFDKPYELASGYNTAERNIFVGLSYQPR